MKKNKLYIIIAVLAIICLFSFSALCTNLKATSDEEIGVEEEEAEEEVVEAEEEEEEETMEEEAEEEEEEEKTEPTIELVVYQDATATDGICFYRVQANITGNPTPHVEWNKDDSGGSWGERKAQVNLYNPSETFTLIGTATNLEGTARDSITLSWECEIPEPEPTEVEDEFPADVSKSGYIIQDTYVGSGLDFICVGDSDENKIIKGYLSFDISRISSLEDIIITKVRVAVPGVLVYCGSPWLAGDLLNIKVRYYGETLDEPADFALGGKLVKEFNTSATIDNFTFSTSKLKEELQKAVNIGRDDLQLKFGLNDIWENDLPDSYSFEPSDCKLEVAYEIIE